MIANTIAMTYTVTEPRVEVYAGFETASNSETRVLLPGTYPVTFAVAEGRVTDVLVRIDAVIARRHIVNRVFTASSVEDSEPMERGYHHLQMYPWTVEVQPGRDGFGYAVQAVDAPAREAALTDEERAMVAGALAAWDAANAARARKYARLNTLRTPFVRKATEGHLAGGRGVGNYGLVLERVTDSRAELTPLARDLAEQEAAYVTVLWWTPSGEYLGMVSEPLDDLRGRTYPNPDAARRALGRLASERTNHRSNA